MAASRQFKYIHVFVFIFVCFVFLIAWNITFYNQKYERCYILRFEINIINDKAAKQMKYMFSKSLYQQPKGIQITFTWVLYMHVVIISFKFISVNHAASLLWCILIHRMFYIIWAPVPMKFFNISCKYSFVAFFSFLVLVSKINVHHLMLKRG